MVPLVATAISLLLVLSASVNQLQNFHHRSSLKTKNKTIKKCDKKQAKVPILSWRKINRENGIREKGGKDLTFGWSLLLENVVQLLHFLWQKLMILMEKKRVEEALKFSWNGKRTLIFVEKDLNHENGRSKWVLSSFSFLDFFL